MAAPTANAQAAPPAVQLATPRAVQLSQDQLATLLNAVRAPTTEAPRATNSMAQCPVKFDGKRNIADVEGFTTRVEVYRRSEHISEADALIGLPLLLTGDAYTWWRGISHSITNWQNALTQIHAAFAPRRANHELYTMLFTGRQPANESTETFIAAKRAILAQISHEFTAPQQIDMLYGLLHL